MTKIYLVEQGEYSDRCTIAAFLDKEKAEKYAEIQDEIQLYDSCYVWEMELMDDKVDIETPVNEYYVYNFDLEHPEEVDDYEVTEHRQDTRQSFTIEYVDSIEGYSQISFEHARKVAEEAYQIKAQQKLVDEGAI